MDFVLKDGDTAAQAVDRVCVTSTSYRKAEQAGHLHGELVLFVPRAAIGAFKGMHQLERRVAQGILRAGGQRVGYRAVQVGTARPRTA